MDLLPVNDIQRGVAKSILRYHLAAFDMLQVRISCKELTNLPRYVDRADEDPIFAKLPQDQSKALGLTYAIVVGYARPFTHSNDFKRVRRDECRTLDDGALRSLHDELIRMRDGSFAHHEAESRDLTVRIGGRIFVTGKGDVGAITETEPNPGASGLSIPSPIIEDVQPVADLAVKLQRELEAKEQDAAAELLAAVEAAGLLPDDV